MFHPMFKRKQSEEQTCSAFFHVVLQSILCEGSGVATATLCIRERRFENMSDELSTP